MLAYRAEGLGYPCCGENLRGFNWSVKESEDGVGQGRVRKLQGEEARDDAVCLDFLELGLG